MGNIDYMSQILQKKLLSSRIIKCVVKLQVYSANNCLAYSVMPQMMIAAPTIFVVVIASLLR